VEPIGIIGLGLMGSALAERFRVAGYPLVGFDSRDEARAAFPGEAKDSVRAVFEAARTVVLSLPNSDVVREVIDEVGEVVNGVAIIDTTTGDPETTPELGAMLRRRSAEYLDATLTGSSREARNGELVVTAGGPRALFAACVPLFRCFAKQWFHVGAWGAGARTKLVVNLVLGLNRAVLAEGLAFARQYGLDPHSMLEVLKSGAAYSRAMDVKGPRMLAGDFAPEARLAQHLKDVRLILAAADTWEASTPFSELHEQLLASLVDRGLGDLDNSAVIRAFETQQNTDPR